MPAIEFEEPIKGAAAEAMKAKCPMGVFDIEDGHLMAKNLRNCTTCRECIRDEDSKVKLMKQKEHYEFSVESVGQISPKQIVLRAINVLKEKAHFWKEIVEELEAS